MARPLPIPLLMAWPLVKELFLRLPLGIRIFSAFHFFDPCGRYARFYGVTDRSNRTGTFTGEPFWTDPSHH